MTKKELAEMKSSEAAHAAIASLAFFAGKANEIKFCTAKKTKPASAPSCLVPSENLTDFQIKRRQLEKLDLSPRLFHTYSKAKLGSIRP